MAFKRFQLSDDISLTVYKRRLSRSIKLSIAANGDVKVSVPSWATFRSGEAFAKRQLEWIQSQRIKPALINSGQSVGKEHILLFKVSTRLAKPTSRINGGQIIITHPLKQDYAHPDVQSIANRAAIRALRQEAESVLPARLRKLAAEHTFEFKSVTIKQLTGRWGSCDQNKDIALNLFLMQLPWDLIDYVLLHELAHTRHLNHGPDFWKTLTAVSPNARLLKASIGKHKPVVLS